MAPESSVVCKAFEKGDWFIVISLRIADIDVVNIYVFGMRVSVNNQTI